MSATKRKRMDCKEYLSFGTIEECQNYLKENQFSKSSIDISSKGVKIRYHCSKHKKCMKNMLEHILIDGNIILYDNGEDHSEENSSDSKRIGSVVNRYVPNIDNLTPTHILDFVSEAYSYTPKQISQLKSRKRRKLNTTDNLTTYIDLKNYIILFSNLSSVINDDDLFATNSIIDTGNVKVAFTTRRLVSLLDNNRCLQLDGTYKITSLNYPILIAGVSDANRKFHPVIILIADGESCTDYIFLMESVKISYLKVFHREYEVQTIMGDAAEAITAASNQMFPNCRRVVCWYHALKRMEKLVNKHCEEEYRDEILEDIHI